MLGGQKEKKIKKNTKKPLRSGSYSSVSTTDTHTHTPRDIDMGTLKDTQRHTWPRRHTKALPGMYRHPHRVMVTKRP